MQRYDNRIIGRSGESAVGFALLRRGIDEHIVVGLPERADDLRNRRSSGRDTAVHRRGQEGQRRHTLALQHRALQLHAPVQNIAEVKKRFIFQPENDIHTPHAEVAVDNQDRMPEVAECARQIGTDGRFSDPALKRRHKYAAAHESTLLPASNIYLIIAFFRPFVKKKRRRRALFDAHVKIFTNDIRLFQLRLRRKPERFTEKQI